MSGVLVTIRGTADASGALRHDFTVQSFAGTLPERLDAVLVESPDDPPFAALRQMASDPMQDTECLTAAGGALLHRLRQHGNGPQALDGTFQAPAGSAEREVRLHIPLILDQPHNLPWELLWDAGKGFLDLSQGLPVLRVIRVPETATRPTGRLGPEGLSVVAVLAARGIDALGEYTALVAALRGYGHPWRLRVYSPDDSVATAITAAADGRITHHHVPTTAAALLREVSQAQPQIVHLFCHGIAHPGGGAVLEVATLLSAAGGAALELSSVDLCSHLPATAWLVTLNACSSAGAPEGSRSVAAELVSAGVPFVVGMREPAEARILHSFTRGFLSDVVARIGTVLAHSNSQELRLAGSMRAGREAIRQHFAQVGVDVTARVKDWSLPVFFTRPDPFFLTPGDPGDPLKLAELQTQRQVLAEFLATQAATLEAGAIGAIAQRIAALDRQIGDLS